MGGFPSFFEKCSNCSRSNGETLATHKTEGDASSAPATPATLATNTPIKINKGFVAGVAALDRPTDLESSVVRNKYLSVATATTATPDLFPVAAVAAVARVARVATDEPAYERGQDRPVLTNDQLLAIPLRSCLDCRQFAIARAHCSFYDTVLPEPTRVCRCRHHRPRGPAH